MTTENQCHLPSSAKVGGNARKTNKDYTDGHLDELVDIIIEAGAKLFVPQMEVPMPFARLTPKIVEETISRVV